MRKTSHQRILGNLPSQLSEGAVSLVLILAVEVRHRQQSRNAVQVVFSRHREALFLYAADYHVGARLGCTRAHRVAQMTHRSSSHTGTQLHHVVDVRSPVLVLDESKGSVEHVW